MDYLKRGFQAFSDWLGKDKIGYIFILPLLFYFVPFRLYPIIRTFILSFMRYEFIYPNRTRFVGFANFVELFSDPRAYETFIIAGKYIVLFIPASVILGLIAAVMIDKLKNQGLATLYRVCFYLPVVLPFAVVFYMWKWVLDPQWGILNHILIDLLGIPWPWQGWILDPATALPSIAGVSTWRLFGFNMIILLVGLNSIDRTLYEAAKVDGANAWQEFRYVTLPLLKPFIIITLIFRLRQLGIIIQPLILTQGGPARSTMTYGLQAYYIAFRNANMRMGYASAWFLLLSVLTGILAFLGWRMGRGR